MSEAWVSAAVIATPIIFYGFRIAYVIVRERSETRACLARIDAMQKRAEEREQDFLASFAAELRKSEAKKGIT